MVRKSYLGNLIFIIAGIGQIGLSWNNIQFTRTIMVAWLFVILVLFNTFYEDKG